MNKRQQNPEVIKSAEYGADDDNGEMPGEAIATASTESALLESLTLLSKEQRLQT